MLAQPQMDDTNRAALYVAVIVGVVALALWAWRQFKRSKTFGTDPKTGRRR